MSTPYHSILKASINIFKENHFSSNIFSGVNKSNFKANISEDQQEGIKIVKKQTSLQSICFYQKYLIECTILDDSDSLLSLKHISIS